MLEGVTNYGKMCRMEHFSALFSNLFPQKRKRISANKFSAELKKRCFVPSRDNLHLVPAMDMRTSLTGTKACPRYGRPRAPSADISMS